MLSFFQVSWGQYPVDITWGPDNLRRANLIDILPDNGLNFYTFQYTSSAILPSPKVGRFIEGKESVTKKIDQHLGQNTVVLEDIIQFNSTLLGFFSDKKGGTNTLFLQAYDTEIDPIGEAIELSSYSMPKGWNNKGEFHLTVSENNQYFCVEYIIPGKKEELDHFGYSIFNTAFAKIGSGEFDIPSDPKNTSIEVRHLTGKGDYLLGVSVFSTAHNGVWRDYSSVQKTMMYQVSKDSLIDYKLMIDDRRIYNFTIATKDSLAIVTGTYGETFTNGARGVFFQRIDINSHRVLSEKIMDFPPEILSDENQQNQYVRAQKRDYVVPVETDLMNYAFRNVSLGADGSFTVVAEQFYIFQQNTSDARGMIQFVNHYYYNDCLVYTIDSTGNYKWLIKIPKEQHSVNDYGYYSSVKVVPGTTDLQLFFNDSRKNYDENGMFIAFNNSFNFPVRKKQYALGKVSINLATGSQTRQMQADYTESQGFISLKISKYTPLKRQLLLISSGRKERFGLIQF